MKPANRLAGIAASLLLLAACQQEKQSVGGKDGGVAANEILPGSASDAMLPYDTVRSQPPLAPRSEGEAKGKPDARKAAADEPAGEAGEGAGNVVAEAPVPAAADEPKSAGAQ